MDLPSEEASVSYPVNYCISCESLCINWNESLYRQPLNKDWVWGGGCKQSLPRYPQGQSRTLLPEVLLVATCVSNKWKNNLHPLHKQESYKEPWLFTSISIFPTIIYSSTFISNKAQSASSVSASSTVHGIHVSTLLALLPSFPGCRPTFRHLQYGRT